MEKGNRRVLEKLYLSNEEYIIDVPMEVGNIHIANGNFSSTSDLYLRGDLYVEGDVQIKNLYLSSAPHHIEIRKGSLLVLENILPECKMGNDHSPMSICVPDGDMLVGGNLYKSSLYITCGYDIYIKGNCILSQISHCCNFICNGQASIAQVYSTMDIYVESSNLEYWYAGRDLYIETTTFSSFEEIYEKLACVHGQLYIPKAWIDKEQVEILL